VYVWQHVNCYNAIRRYLRMKKIIYTSSYICIYVLLCLTCKAQTISNHTYSDDEIYKIIDTMLNHKTPNRFLLSQLTNYINWRKTAIPGDSHYNYWDMKTVNPYKDRAMVDKDSTLQIQFKEFYSDFVPPVIGPITSNFGCRDRKQHKGVDIDLTTGDKVYCAFAGMVRIAQRDKGYGNVVIVRHYNGLETTYAHLSKLKVKAGDVVRAGKIIGLGGNTGHSEGSHLHFETRFKGIPINPNFFISFKNYELQALNFTVKPTKLGFTAYPTNSTVYTIRRGDNLSALAQRYGTTVKKIKDLNGFNKKFALRVGQQIRVS
jgi:murein DD-endopeptidase MepM/ murein hydrolase activator NlpD